MLSQMIWERADLVFLMAVSCHSAGVNEERQDTSGYSNPTGVKQVTGVEHPTTPVVWFCSSI
jgi:hypothetical protein